MTSDAAKQLLLSAVSFGLIVAILVFMADTKLYPVALGAVIIALVYVLMDNQSLIKVWQGLIDSANKNLT